MVEAKMWPAADAEPAWGDPRFGGAVALPAGWDAPGRPGWYAGHIGVGQQITYTDLVPAYPAPVAPPPAP